MTLTEAAYWTKKLIWFVIGGFAFFFLLIALIINRSTPQQLPQYLYPDFACTASKQDFLRYKLEIPSIDYTLESSENAFSLETQTGRVDELPDIVNVYRYDNPGQYLTVQDDARNLAEKLAFDPERIQRIGTTAYRWVDRNYRTLTVQARNFTFDFKTDLSQTSARPEGELPTEAEAKQTARGILNSNGLLYKDYSQEAPLTLDITITPDGSYREGKYKQETNLIRVDFIRKASMITIPSNIEGSESIKNMLERKGHRATEEVLETPEGKIPLYKFNTLVTTLDPYKSNISVYVGSDNLNLDVRDRILTRIYAIEYKNWIIEPEYCGTYKLVNPAQVLNSVQNQEASLVYLNEKDGDKVLQGGSKSVSSFTIKDINIFYYDAPYEQEYLQPIYVITGEAIFTNGRTGEFAFYHPAIDYDFMDESLEL